MATQPVTRGVGLVMCGQDRVTGESESEILLGWEGNGGKGKWGGVIL